VPDIVCYTGWLALKTLLLITLLTLSGMHAASEATRYAKHSCYVQRIQKACDLYKKLQARDKDSDTVIEVVQKREIASISSGNDPIVAFNHYLSLIENLNPDDYGNLKELVSSEAMANMNKHKSIMGFYFAMVKSKLKAGLYKNGELSISENKAKIVYSPVEYVDSKSGKNKKTGATIYMVMESNRWLFHQEKGFTEIN